MFCDIKLVCIINFNGLFVYSILQKLTSRGRYPQAIFRSEFMGEFLSVLLSGLAEGGARALLRDEALAALHAMASVDFPAFRHAFLPHYLASLALDPHHVQLLADFPPDTVCAVLWILVCLGVLWSPLLTY